MRNSIRRVCSSGLQAIALAADEVQSGRADVAVAGGTESMSCVPTGGHKIAPNPTLLESAKLTVQVLTEMERPKARYGLVAMCVGGDRAAAGILERFS